MARFCEEKGQAFSQNFLVAKVFESACEAIIPFFGIQPVTTSHSYPIAFWGLQTDLSFLNPKSPWFPIAIFCLTTLIAFVLGIYVKRWTIVALLRQKEEWADREKMLLNQLWAALEEKLESKSMLQESKSTLERLKVELNSERSEKQSLQTKMWGLDRNLQNLQSERDILEGKLKECIVTFSGIQHSFQDKGEGCDVNVSTCMDKIKSLQSLMQKLIEAHRQERKNFIAILEKPPSC